MKLVNLCQLANVTCKTRDKGQQEESETMFLGVFVDNNLSWKSHISLLASKLSKSIGIIHKSRFFLSTHSLQTLFNSMILTNLYYCNLAWGGTYKTNLQRIVIAFMIKFPYNARSDWLKQRTLSENKEQVNDTKLAFKVLLRNFDKFGPN